MFDLVLTYRRRKWEWQVSERLGDVILHGWESTRAEAKYQAERGLFLLLMGTRPKSCALKRPGEHGGNCHRAYAGYACDIPACLKMPSDECRP